MSRSKLSIVVLLVLVVLSVAGYSIFSKGGAFIFNEKEILRKIKFPLPRISSNAANFEMRVNYIVEDGCADCLAGFFKEEFKKRGWQIAETRLVDPFLELFRQYKEVLSNNPDKAGTAATVPGLDKRVADVIANSDPAIMEEKIRQTAPIVLEGEDKTGYIKYTIYVRALPDTGKSAITINLLVERSKH